MDLTFGWIFAIIFVFGNRADSCCLYRLYALQWWIMLYGFSWVYLLMLTVLFLAWAGMFKGWSKWSGSCYRSRQVSGITEKASPVHIQLGECLVQVQQLLPVFWGFKLSPMLMSCHFKHTKWFAMDNRIWCNYSFRYM